MRICVFDSLEQCGKAAATLLAAQVIKKPDSVLGLATGSSPVPCYQELIRLNQIGVLDFSQVTTFNLDEYIGIPEEHVCSYHRFMREQLFDHVNIRKEAIHVPDGNAPDETAAGIAYDEAIRAAGGIDIQVLGIGRNGHIGFNEPSDHFTEGCHVVDLTESTIQANTRFFNSMDEVPRQAITMGISSIMNARCVMLIATGASKADAVYRTVHGEIDPRVQASILKCHTNAVLLLDKAAASLL